MDIVKHIEQHTENLQNGLANSSFELRKQLKIATLYFYFQLPDFEETVSKHIRISINKEQLIFDINNENVQNYQIANEKSNAEIDVYADDYEEPEPIEILMLNAFENAISDLKSTKNLVGLFVGIIDTLDYYENFSDKPEYWNDLLEKEVELQNQILTELKSKNFDTSIYQKRYKGVKFSEHC